MENMCFILGTDDLRCTADSKSKQKIGRITHAAPAVFGTFGVVQFSRRLVSKIPATVECL